MYLYTTFGWLRSISLFDCYECVTFPTLFIIHIFFFIINSKITPFLFIIIYLEYCFLKRILNLVKHK